MVGEWTKVPDRDIANMEDDCAKKGLPVRIRNAEPYREFQNFEDNDRYSLNTKYDEAIDHYIPLSVCRYYGMNEGYWRNMAINPLNLAQAQAAPPANAGLESAASSEEIQFRHKRLWGYIYRPYKAAPAQSS